jgi:hypothetical protein
MKRTIASFLLTVFSVIALVLTGCTTSQTANLNNPTSTNGTSTTLTQTGATVNGSPVTQSLGKLEVRVTDAPAKEQITAINVTINSIEVHKAAAGENTTATATETVEGTEQTADQDNNDGGWITISNQSMSFDLLKIKDNLTSLQMMDIGTGKYTQARLGVESVSVSFAGNQTPVIATVPSRKIKFLRTFDISPDGVTHLDFDFDATRSVNITGNGKVMFKPVIKLSVVKTESPEKKANLTISNESLVNGVVNANYEVELTAAGGKTPYTWSLNGGNLPPGLTLDAVNGKIFGVPTIAGSYNFSIKVADSSVSMKTAVKNLTILIKTPTP